jgi:hypothetical protein
MVQGAAIRREIRCMHLNWEHWLGALTAHTMRTDVQLLLSVQNFTCSLGSEKVVDMLICVNKTHDAGNKPSMALLSWVGLWADSQGLAYLRQRRERALSDEIAS